MPELPKGEITTDVRSLSERLDGPIEDVSVGVSALLSKIVRQSIKSGIQKLDEGLEDSVRAKIDDDIERRGPELDTAARDSARAEVGEQVDRLRRQAKESGARIMAHLESLDEMLRGERENRREIQTEVDAHLRQLRGEFSDHQKELSSQVRHFTQRVDDAKENAVGIGRRAEESLKTLNAQLRERCQALEGTIEAQHRQMVKLQQQVAEYDHLIQRTKTLEEKVFAPGFFGRLFGRKPKLPEGT